MATCGYICPICEGKGFLENLETCDYCSPKIVKPVIEIQFNNSENKSIISDQDWIDIVHNGPCCGDRD